jgi:hypothetical protein
MTMELLKLLLGATMMLVGVYAFLLVVLSF